MDGSTNSKSAVTESRVIAGLTAAGYPCYVPTGVGKADLVIETAEGLKSIQCKTARHVGEGRLMFNANSVLRSGGAVGYKGAVDYFGVVCPGVPGVFLIPVEDAPDTRVTLRLAAARSATNARWAHNYLVAGSELC